MALRRLYLDAATSGCDHVTFYAYLDSARTQELDSMGMTIAELKQDATELETRQEIKGQIIYVGKRAFGNSPGTTKGQLRTAIRAWECWI